MSYRQSEVLAANLQTLGLTPTEARAYLALVKLGAATTIEIAEEARLQRTEIYRLMSRLVTIGLVEETLDAPKRYRASDPRRAIPRLAEQAAKELHKVVITAQDLVAKLNLPSHVTSLRTLPEVRVLDRRSTIQSNYLELLACAQEEIWMMATRQQVLGGSRQLVARTLKTISSKRLKVRLITELDEATANHLRNQTGLVEIRHCEQIPAHLYGFDDIAVSVGLTPWHPRSPRRMSEVRITHHGCVRAMRGFFEAFWEQATPLNVWLAAREQDQSTYSRRTVIWGREQMYRAVADWHIKARERILDYMPTENGPARVVRHLRDSFTEAYNRGLMTRSLCHISPTNLAAVREMCKFNEVRHIEASPGLGFSVLDNSEAIIQYIQTDTSDASCPSDITIYTTDQDAVRRLGEMFDLLWKNSIPVEDRIRELSRNP